MKLNALNAILRRSTAEIIQKPKIVCICGSSRFNDEIAQANVRFTLQGKIVISTTCLVASNIPRCNLDNKSKQVIFNLNMQKIQMADEIYIVNPDAYIGEFTQQLIAYARMEGKPLAYMCKI
jgi:hypothetical protein